MRELPGLAAIESRRATKHFERGYEIPGDVFRRIIAGVTELPGGIDLDALRIVDVIDPTIREGIARVGFAQPQYTEASKILALFYDMALGGEKCSDLRGYNGRDVAMNCAGIVAQQIMINGMKVGIDSCPMIGFDYEEVGKLLRKPQRYLLLMIVALGKRRAEFQKRPPRLDVKDIVTYNAVRL